MENPQEPEWKTLASFPNDMSLRDYFAGQALIGLLSTTKQEDIGYSEVHCRNAYLIADALLKERLKNED